MLRGICAVPELYIHIVLDRNELVTTHTFLQGYRAISARYTEKKKCFAQKNEDENILQEKSSLGCQSCWTCQSLKTDKRMFDYKQRSNKLSKLWQLLGLI